MDLLKEVKRKNLIKKIIIVGIIVVILIILSFVIFRSIKNRENDLINKRIVSAKSNSIIIINNDLSNIHLYPETLKNIKENGKKLQINKHNEAEFLLNSNYLQEYNKIDAKVTTTNQYTQLNNVVCIETDLTKMQEKAMIEKITVHIEKMNLDTEFVDLYAVNQNGEFIAYRLKEKITNNTISINIADRNIDKYIVAYVPVNNLAFNYDEINLKKGEEIILTCDLNENATNSQLKARVADPNIIEVGSNGTIKAINAGTTTLVIQSYKNTMSKTIVVNVKEIPSEIKVNEEKVKIYAGEGYQVEVTVLPEALENKKVKYASSNNKIVTVDNKGKITGMKKGTAQITITTEETPQISKIIEVTVEEKPSELRVDQSEIELYVEDSDYLNVTVLPENLENKEVTYVTSDDNIAIVDKNGKVTGIAEGTAQITITTKLEPAISLTVTVHVKTKQIEQNILTENNIIIWE